MEVAIEREYTGGVPMKKWILLVFIIVLLLPGCHKQGTKIAMPETLKLETQLPQEYPKKANVYQVNWNEIDGDTAEQTLFINDTSNCIDEYEDIQYV